MPFERKSDNRSVRRSFASQRNVPVWRRLAVLCSMLIVVLILMVRLNRPVNWEWLRPSPTSAVGDPARTTATAEPRASATPVWLPQLDRSLLATVRDDTYFRTEERPAWFHLLQLLRDTPLPVLAAASNGPTTYMQLDRQTAAYRGQIVDLQGTVRRIVQVAAPPNSIGIERYFQCWLFPDERLLAPIVVYVLDLPRDVHPGMSVEVPVSLHGFVYKRWPFQSGEGLTVAPVVLARQMQTLAAPAASATNVARTRHRLSPPLIVGGAAVAAIAAAGWIAYFSSRDRRRQDNAPVVEPIGPPPEFDHAPTNDEPPLTNEDAERV
jgi:hypothetical protein